MSANEAQKPVDEPEGDIPVEEQETVEEVVDDLAARLSAAEAERDQMKDRMMRALAEVENTRKRMERERIDARKYGAIPLLRDILSVHDNLRRALDSADDGLRSTARDFIEGVELTGKELSSAFEKHNVKRILPEKGTRFDPNLHQAMFEAPIPGAPDGSIIEVMQDGFMVEDRLVRPAMVGVARGGGAAPTADNNTPGEES